MKTHVTSLQCNCCNTRAVDITNTAKPFVNKGSIALLYGTTRGAFVCERCVVTHVLLVTNNGNPVLAYNVESGKYQATPEFKRTYSANLKHDPEDIIAGESHLKYDLQTHVEKTKGKYVAQKEQKSLKREKPLIPVIERKSAEVNEEVLDAVFG